MTTVSGPVAGGAHGRPFSMPLADLDAARYVAEEFFVDGVATAHALAGASEYTPDGRWTTMPTTTAPYRTRLLVVRPVDRAACNGTVIVNWQNVSAGYEVGTADSGVIPNGFIWVGVSAQEIGVTGEGDEPLGLVQWDPDRYGSLVHPGDPYSFDIFASVAEVLRARRGTSGGLDPLAGSPVERLVAVGASQSAMRLRTYINALHPTDPVFDAFLLLRDFGAGARLEAPTSGLGNLSMVATRVREDLDVPTFVVITETEVPRLFPVRQADTERFRTWEVAGTAHAGGSAGMQALVSQFARDGMAMGGAGFSLEGDPPGELAFAPVQDVVYRHIHDWLVTGHAPPSQPLVDCVDGEIVRDADGNATGGVRLPDMAVPTATHLGSRPGGIVNLMGAMRPFSSERIAELYPSADDYLKRHAVAVQECVAAGTIDPDAAAAFEHAAAARARTLFSD